MNAAQTALYNAFRMIFVLSSLYLVLNFAGCVDQYGPVVEQHTVVSPYGDNLQCTQYLHAGGQKQIICFDEFDAPQGWSWFFDTAATPAYVIEDSVHTSLF